MTAKSPEWVNLMLDLDPVIPAAIEKQTRRARKIAITRTQQLGQPDAHAVRVASLAAETAWRLGLGHDDIETVVEGALLHDLGKARVPRAILDQCRPLTRAEYVTVMQHPVWGAELVKGHVSERALLVVRHHHERFDGTGYPDRLKGEEIPLGARIIHVADALDSMLTTRIYRAARPAAEALGELRRAAGTQFCPRCVGALERILPLESLASDADRPQIAAVAS